jgi:hypothetical protein
MPSNRLKKDADEEVCALKEGEWQKAVAVP